MSPMLSLLLFLAQDAAQVAGEIERLKGDDAEAQVRAAQKLLEWSEQASTQDAVRGALQELAQSPVAAHKARAAQILRHLELRGRMPPRLRAVVGMSEELLTASGYDAWEWARSKPLQLGQEDLSFLVEEAFRRPGSSDVDDQKWALLHFMVDERLRKCLPHAIELFQDPNKSVRMAAMNALIRLRAKEIAPKIGALLKDPDKEISENAHSALM